MKRICKHVLPILFCVSLLLGVCAISASAYSGDTVIVGKGKKSIGPNDVSKYRNATEIVVADGVTEILNDTFSHFDMKAVTLPNSLISIGNSAFNSCKNLTEITIPKSVFQIGSYAFQRCEKLTSVTIPESVTSIGRSAFHLCDKLTTVYFNATHCNKGDGNWFGTQNNVKKLVIGLSVNVIPKEAFAYCSNLESLTIPANVKTIENYAFQSCKKLKLVTLEEGLERIEDSAFYGCEALTEITIPNSVTYIGTDAFADCNKNLKINIEDESLLEPVFRDYGWGTEATVLLIILLTVPALIALATYIIYLVGCVKITKLYCRKKGTSAGGLIALAVIASLLGLGFLYLLIFAILNRGENEQTV